MKSGRSEEGFSDNFPPTSFQVEKPEQVKIA